MDEIMRIKEFYNAVGGSYDAVIQRLPSNELIVEFLQKFLADPSYAELMKARDNNDVHSAFLAAHTLKGLAATLGLDTLADAAGALTEALRSKNAMPADSAFETVASAYAQAVTQIAALRKQE